MHTHGQVTKLTHTRLLDSGRKPERLDGAHANKGKTCKLLKERFGANYCTTPRIHNVLFSETYNCKSRMIWTNHAGECLLLKEGGPAASVHTHNPGSRIKRGKAFDHIGHLHFPVTQANFHWVTDVFCFVFQLNFTCFTKSFTTKCCTNGYGVYPNHHARFLIG